MFDFCKRSPRMFPERAIARLLNNRDKKVLVVAEVAIALTNIRLVRNMI
ncbi:MAG: hypothetical protein KME28_02720 [Pelatocladus maniniholoensis HA4357-MV3]|uniref:Uncharacterized protein n=1 Tax=Pelatocladus maniniholoensis HA4357-MV3 TaxID=1117104 RepID=A0A9E3H3Y7_9NOST|nr:hypothetical protein [Pelatocladus maniniholoensis HA4357-MV3]